MCGSPIETTTACHKSKPRRNSWPHVPCRTAFEGNVQAKSASDGLGGGKRQDLTPGLPLRVEPELREAAESVLRDGETLSGLIETSVRETIQRRRVQEEFIARGLRAREDAERTGTDHSAESVHSELQRRLDARRKSALG